MALGAIPVVVNAADVQTINPDVLASTDGSKTTYSVGKLVPGKYKFTTQLTSKVYGVNIAIGGKSLNVIAPSYGSDVEIEFELTQETDVELTLESTDPGESGAGFTVASPVVSLSFDLATIKSTLAGNAETLATTISGYSYAAKQDDVDAANALKTKANGLKDTYDDYKNFKLYATKSTIQEEIDALANKAAKAEAAYQNEQAYNRVNAAIADIKAKYNAAVAQLEETLVGAAAYLLDAAKDELNTEINLPITEATKASYASYTAATAVADEAANTDLIPTVDDLNAIVDEYETQATNNKNAYNTLHGKVTTLQAQLDAIAPIEAIAAQFATEKTAAQSAIDAVNTKVEGAKNSAAQLTLDVTTEEATAQGKINTLAGKVNTANAEYNANKATTEAIAAVQTKLNDAKTAVNAKTSADGNYKAQDYYEAYVTDVQGDIDKLTTDATAAYKADGTGTAQTYNAGLAAKTGVIEAKITAYQTNAVDAVTKYDALQTAIAGYQEDLDEARAQMEGLAVYTDEGYDYKTELDLIQKRINDIKKAITAAQGKVGAEHWNAMLVIDEDATITGDIADLLSAVQGDQNEYDANTLAGEFETLDARITAFNTTYATDGDTKLGDDYESFADVEDDIKADFTAVTTAKAAINSNSDTVDYTGKVGTGVESWTVGTGNNSHKSTYSGGGVTLIEHFGETSIGTMISQEVEVENGLYDIEVYATSHNAHGGNYATYSDANPAPALEEDAEDVAYVFGKSGNNYVEKYITARKNGGFTAEEPGVYTIPGVKVENGKLTIGLALAKAGQCEWHTLQIKSLKANTASLIQGWGAKIDDLNARQDALEAVASDVAAKVTANTNAKTTLATSIDNLQTQIGTFETNYKIGQDESTLGNRGKAGGSIKTEVDEIKTALNTLEGNNNAIDPTAVTEVDKTSKVSNDAAAWNGAQMPADDSFAEKYETNVNTVGVLLTQTVTGLDKGIYTVILNANANFTSNRGFNSDMADGATDIAYVFANGKNVPVTAHIDGGTDGEYTIEDVLVTDGTLTMGLAKAKAGTNWHTIKIKSLTYHENSQLNTYNTEETGYNKQYSALASQVNALEEAAPGIKTAVANNKAAKEAADAALTDLGTYKTNQLKSLPDVTDANGDYDGGGVATKTVNGAAWKVYESGLATTATFTAEVNAVNTNIAALQAAIDAAFAAETMPTPWAGEITVVEGESSTTYKIAEIKAAIDAIKAKAATESANYQAYSSVTETNVKAVTDAIAAEEDGLAAAAGAGAEEYYAGLLTGYGTQVQTICNEMVSSLNARTAASKKSGWVDALTALKGQVTVVKSNAAANLAKYNEQKTASEETQTLWNSTYTEIAATDNSSKVQDWLDQLDEIQIALTAATEAVEANYPKGESVAKAKDFAAIKAAINDVKAQQSEQYNAAIAADNKAAHESFMGKEDGTKGTIQLATEAYQRAVQERAKYSSTNEDIKEAITNAAATLDEILYNCPTDIQTLTEEENAAYVATTSPTVFEVNDFNTAANAITGNINDALNTFKADVQTAITDYWTPMKDTYNGIVYGAEDEISDYSEVAKTDAFKDVETLIAKGNAGVASMTLSEVEEAIAGLEDIDDMIAADKDAAAVKDLEPRVTVADSKYTEVQNYINGVTNDIPAKAEQLEALEEAYEAVIWAKEQDKNFENRDNIKGALAGFMAAAEVCKQIVVDAVAADNANTAAYGEMTEALDDVEAKLADAIEKAAQYKYETSFAGIEEWLDGLREDAADYKAAGAAAAQEDVFMDNIDALDAAIDNQLIDAFYTELTGLSADITELKNQYNAYVAANGLNETATAFKTAIDELEGEIGAADIVDLDDPADGVDYDDIVAATDALVELQNDIADLETELLTANASAANADVLADFIDQLEELEATASLEYDEWVGQQMYDEDMTLDEQITDLKNEIAETRAAIEAEENISFYKDKYQKQIDAIKEILDHVAEEITAYQGQFTENATAYQELTEELDRLQGLVDAAVEKVSAYEYADAEIYYGTYIDNDILWGPNRGVQNRIDAARETIENSNANKTAQFYNLGNTSNIIEQRVQEYLDNSAFDELDAQNENLYTLLDDAIDVDNHEGVEKYSNALWGRLIDEVCGIAADINNLGDAIDYSYQTGYYDADNHWIPKPRTSDADYDDQIELIKGIQTKIVELGEAVDNLGLLGDANEDGKVNVLDYQKIVNMILDPTIQPEEDSDLFANIDINQNDVIEVGDLTALVSYILNGEWQGYAAAPARNMAGRNESLSMNTTQMEKGVQRIAVNLVNANDYTAFQLDVVLPDGMSIVGASLSDRAGASHKLYSRKQLDGSIRMLVSSVAGESFKGNEGAVLYIDVTGANAANVELLNILFSDLGNSTRSFVMGADGNATGIDSMNVFADLKQKVYDLGGKMLNDLKKGVNIIRNANGTSKKVLK